MNNTFHNLHDNVGKITAVKNVVAINTSESVDVFGCIVDVTIDSLCWRFLPQLPVSLILMSLKWWENYVPRGKKNSGTLDPNQVSLSMRLFRFKKQLHQYRTKLNTVMSLWNYFFCNVALWALMMIEGDTVIFNTFTPYKSYNVEVNSTATDDPSSALPQLDYYVCLTQVCRILMTSTEISICNESV